MPITIKTRQQKQAETQTELLSYQQVAQQTGMTVEALRSLVKRGLFPKPIKIGLRKVAFRQDEITRWVAIKSADRKNAPDRESFSAMVLKALQNGDTLTTWGCLKAFDSPWLSQVICSLRRKGYLIESKRVDYLDGAGVKRYYHQHHLVK